MPRRLPEERAFDLLVHFVSVQMFHRNAWYTWNAVECICVDSQRVVVSKK